MAVVSQKLPAISSELMEQLEQAFPGPRIAVGYDKEQVLWDQAQREVVEFIRNRTSTKTVNGRPIEPAEPVTRTKFAKPQIKYGG